MTDNYKYKGPVKTALTLYNRYVRGGRLVVRLAMYLFLSIVSFVFLLSGKVKINLSSRRSIKRCSFHSGKSIYNIYGNT